MNRPRSFESQTTFWLLPYSRSTSTPILLFLRSRIGISQSHRQAAVKVKCDFQTCVEKGALGIVHTVKRFLLKLDVWYFRGLFTLLQGRCLFLSRTLVVSRRLSFCCPRSKPGAFESKNISIVVIRILRDLLSQYAKARIPEYLNKVLFFSIVLFHHKTQQSPPVVNPPLCQKNRGILKFSKILFYLIPRSNL